VLKLMSCCYCYFLFVFLNRLRLNKTRKVWEGMGNEDVLHVKVCFKRNRENIGKIITEQFKILSFV